MCIPAESLLIDDSLTPFPHFLHFGQNEILSDSGSTSSKKSIKVISKNQNNFEMLQPMVRVRQSSEKRVYLTVCVYWYLYIGGSKTCLVHSTCLPLARKGLLSQCMSLEYRLNEA